MCNDQNPDYSNCDTCKVPNCPYLDQEEETDALESYELYRNGEEVEW